ncbi:hypothetical protein, partial [Kineococcus sp. SYSU DK003]|uniref:hypothetical protein n=1 Tax=Kineococcus sp. SYSU DK003 TaxID=3383124 RepID=UPI003D7E9CCD
MLQRNGIGREGDADLPPLPEAAYCSSCRPDGAENQNRSGWVIRVRRVAPEGLIGAGLKFGLV